MANEIATVDKNREIIEGVKNTDDLMYCSFTVETTEDKVKLYNATSSEGESVKSHVNKEFMLRDVIIMPAEIVDDEKGNQIVPRITFITADGKCLTATSWGLYRSVQKIASIFGGLHFDDPIKVCPVEVRTKKGFTMNLKLV